MNHTKGPWTIWENGIYGTDNKCVCVPFSLNWSNNSRIIAAAPEMLDALIVAYNALEYVSDYDIPLCTHETVKKAIERATNMKIEEVIYAKKI